MMVVALLAAVGGCMLRHTLIALGTLLLTACAHVNAAGSAHAQEAAASVPAPGSSRPQEMLSRLVGRWVLTGTIAGQSTVHDVEADWALQGNYVRLSEISRERGDNGQPIYEATVFIGWAEGAHRYVCIWLDNTEVASGGVTCSAADAQDAIPLEFRDAQGTLILTNTFLYDADSGAWEWRIDNVRGNAVTPFARVSLRRR
jgi:hypothetical protein